MRGSITADEDWLKAFVLDASTAITAVDTAAPVWTSATTGKSYQPGIGPHPETRTLELVTSELARLKPEPYGRLALNVPYPAEPKKKCDLVVDDWALEVKMLRLMGDNGKPNDNMLMHILSPYPSHRSALTDCSKLVTSGFPGNLAVLIYGFDYPSWPMDPAITAFERLAREEVVLGPRCESAFAGLIHPIHQEGRVFGWQVEPKG
jgi:hypothetical protein